MHTLGAVLLVAAVVMAVRTVHAGAVEDSRACHQPGHTSYPFCDTSKSVEARVADLVSRIKDEDKPALLTARGWPQGQTVGLPYLGVPAHDWGLNCVHGVQASAINSSTGMRAPTSFPNPVALGASWNMSLVKGMGAIMGTEVRALYLAGATEASAWSGKAHIGLDCWSPNINLNRDPRWGRNMEVASEDPKINGDYGVAYTTGLQASPADTRFLQAIVTLKHWDAYSLEDSDGFTRHNFNAVVSSGDLTDSYMPAFKASVVDGNAKGIMCSYNAVNGVPTCASSFLTHYLDLWNYTGYVTSDTDAISDIYPQHHYTKSDAESCCKALTDGRCDINSGGTYMKNIPEMLKPGATECSIADVDRALTHIYTVLFEAGLFDPIEDQPFWKVPPEAVNTAESQAFNLLATCQSLVLLRNKDGQGKPVLPFSPLMGQTYAVIGPHGNASAALLGNYLGDVCTGGFGDSSCVTSTLDAITAEVTANGGQVTYSPGCDITSNGTHGEFEAALKVAAAADVVIMGMGIDTHVEAESHDRSSIDLPQVQHDLIAAVTALGKPTAVYLLNGGMVALEPELSSTSSLAILEAHYPGYQGGTAIADALFGKYNPGGKLAYTMYASSYTDEIKMDNMNMTAVNGSPGRSYKYYTGKPLLPFGFGLSYSTFQLSFGGTAGASGPVLADMHTSTLHVGQNMTITISNTGSMDGDEVVQLYFTPERLDDGSPPGIVGSLRRQLFAYERVAVAAGAKREVAFHVSPADLLVVDPGTGDRVSAPGQYRITVTNGVNETLTAFVNVRGPLSLVEEFPREW